MHPQIAEKRDQLSQLCRRFGVQRLEVFGSGARGVDFDPARSDIDLLVDFGPGSANLSGFLDFQDALEALFGRRVDLVTRSTIEKSPNYIRRRAILRDAQQIYG